MELPVGAQMDGNWYRVALAPCRCGVLAHLLNKEVPYVFAHGHYPHERVEWRAFRLPLRAGGESRPVEARGLRFDMQASTEEFLSWLKDFDTLGIELYQSTRRIPDTLVLEGISPEKSDGILIANGVVAKFVLPHANEVACFWTTQREHLEAVLTKPEIRALVIDDE